MNEIMQTGIISNPAVLLADTNRTWVNSRWAI